MALEIRVDTSGFDGMEKRLAERCTRAAHAVAVQAEKDTRPFVPALTKSLSNRTRVVGNAIVYPGPYARFLYYGKVMIDPNTGSTYAPKGGTKVAIDKDLVFTQSVHPQAQSHWFEASKAQNLGKWVRTAKKAVKKYGKG